MKTQHSFTFKARRFVPPELERCNSIESHCSSRWVVSAGRWDSHLAAATKAAEWLIAMAKEDAQQHEVSVIQVEELELLEQ